MYTKSKAITVLNTLCRAYKLCPRFCGLQATFEKCSHYEIQCKGVCNGNEEVTIYNDRAQKALQSLEEENDTYVIKEKGRTEGETAFVYINKGVYKGFGFISQEDQVTQLNDLEPHLIAKKNTYHTDSIIKNYLKRTSKYVKLTL